MGGEKPEAEDGFGQDVEDCIDDDLGVDRGLASALSETPNTVYEW